MDSFNPNFWLSLAGFIWMIGLTIVAFMRKPGEDATKAIGDLRESISLKNQAFSTEVGVLRQQCLSETADLRARQGLLEERLSHLPTHSDTRLLFDRMAEMSGKLTALAEGQRSQQSSLQLIQEFLHSKN